MDAAGERSFVVLGRSRMPYPAVVPSVCEINGKSFVNVYEGRFVRGCWQFVTLNRHLCSGEVDN